MEKVNGGGCNWVREVFPGTDNSFHQAFKIPGCFNSAGKQKEFLRKLDLLSALDSGSFSITLVLHTAGNRAECRSDSFIYKEEALRSALRASEDFSNVDARVVAPAVLACKAGIDINQLIQLYPSSRLKTLDRVSNSLYTELSSILNAIELQKLSVKKVINSELGATAGILGVTRGNPYGFYGYGEGDYML